MLSFCRVTVDELITATWNMQGASGGGQSKWSTTMDNIMNDYVRDRRGNMRRTDVLALQEAGVPPRDATEIEDVTRPTFDEYGSNYHADERVYSIIWRSGSRKPELYVYYVLVAQRVHTAIVSRRDADQVLLFPAMTSSLIGYPSGSARPILGIRIDDNYFFTVHAGSANDGDRSDRNEAMRTIQTIEHYMNVTVLPHRPDATWMIMGDFNRTPNNVRRESNQFPPIQGITRQLVYRGEYVDGEWCPIQTHDRGLALDFAVMGGGQNFENRPLAAYTIIGAAAGQLESDHTPIRFGRF